VPGWMARQSRLARQCPADKQRHLHARHIRRQRSVTRQCQDCAAAVRRCAPGAGVTRHPPQGAVWELMIPYGNFLKMQRLTLIRFLRGAGKPSNVPVWEPLDFMG
jgi:hypothetical protein